MNLPISFDQDVKLVNELLAVLLREQSNLIKMDIDSIEVLLEEKAALVQRISEVAKVRYTLLGKNGFEPNEAGMLVYIEQQVRSDLNNVWRDFQKTLSQAKEMNRLNGILINKHFSRNQQLLNHLQGASSATTVYGRDGQAKSPSTSRSTLTA